jgi:hypothetical protein
MVEMDNEATAAIGELTNLKAKIEQESSELIEERLRLLERLKLIRQEKESQRAKNAELYQKLVRVRLESLAAKRRVQSLACHVEWQKQTNQSSNNRVLEELAMARYSESVEKLRDSIESALNFYNEDSLQMELVKRNNANRDIRVELTRIVNEIEQRKKEIEAEIEEKKRIKQAELERQKQEEERNRLIAEEKARMSSKYQPPGSGPESLNTFRSVTFSTRSPEPFYKSNFSRNSSVSSNLDGRNPKDSNSKGTGSDSIPPSFSQLFRSW